MQKPKIIQVRKDQTCIYCHGYIPKGEKAYFYKSRTPVYDDDQALGWGEKQTGIHYHTEYGHYEGKGCLSTLEIKILGDIWSYQPYQIFSVGIGVSLQNLEKGNVVTGDSLEKVIEEIQNGHSSFIA